MQAGQIRSLSLTRTLRYSTRSLPRSINVSIMTLSAKNSRKIVVNNQEYRWSPSQDSGYMVLVVQNVSGRGKKLEVVIPDDNNVVI